MAKRGKKLRIEGRREKGTRDRRPPRHGATGYKPPEGLDIDERDLKIIEMLQKNARTPFLEIARELGVSGATVHERVGNLMNAGVITGFTTKLDTKKLGYEVVALIGVVLDHPTIDLKELNGALKSTPEVQEAHNVTGDTDVVLKVKARSIDDLRKLLVEKIQYIKGVRRINSSIVLDSPVERSSVALS